MELMRQTLLTPKDLGFYTTSAGAVILAGTGKLSTVFGTAGHSQFNLDIAVTRVAASAWTVYLEHSPDYSEVGAASAHWFRVPAESPGAIAAGACTVTLGDATWSFTTSSATDTISIALPINYMNMRFFVDNTAGTTDTALAWVTLGVL